jgi:hypothetical protein
LSGDGGAAGQDASAGASGAGGSGGSNGDSGTDASDAASPRTVTLTTYIQFAQSNLSLVAGRDGDGPWAVLPGAGGRYQLQVTGERYSFVTVCGQERVVIYDFTVSEWPDPIAGCAAIGPTHEVSGTIDGVPAGSSMRLSFGHVEREFLAAETIYTNATPQGTWDAIATRRDATQVNKIILERDVNVFGALTMNFDFASQGFAPVSHPFAVTGVASNEIATSSSSFLSHLGTVAALGRRTGTALFVPESELFGNDVHSVGAVARDDAKGTTRVVSVRTRLPRNVTLALPPVFEAELTVAATTPQVLFSFSFDVAPGALVYENQFVQYKAALDGSFVWWSRVSAGWLGSAPRATYTFPDLSGLPGWSDALNPAVGVSTNYEIAAVGSNRGMAGWRAAFGQATRQVTPAGLDGLEISYAQKAGELLP